MSLTLVFNSTITAVWQQNAGRQLLSRQLCQRFRELNSRVTFAGYRFSEKNYMT